jgi:hypothetical protein
VSIFDYVNLTSLPSTRPEAREETELLVDEDEMENELRHAQHLNDNAGSASAFQIRMHLFVSHWAALDTVSMNERESPKYRSFPHVCYAFLDWKATVRALALHPR